MGVAVIDELLTGIGQRYDYEEHGGASYTAYLKGMATGRSTELDFYTWLHGNKSGINVEQDVAAVYIAYEEFRLGGEFQRTGQVFIRFHHRHKCANFIAEHCKGFQLQSFHFYMNANASNYELICPGGPPTNEASMRNARNRNWMRESFRYNDRQDYAKDVSQNLRAVCTDFCKPLRVDNHRYNFGGTNELSIEEIRRDPWSVRNVPPYTERRAANADQAGGHV